MKKYLMSLLLACSMSLSAFSLPVKAEEIIEDEIVEQEESLEENVTEEKEIIPDEEIEEEVITEEAMDACLYDGILRYVYMDEINIQTTDTQKIVVALTDPVDSISLTVSNESNTYVLECTNNADTLYEFDHIFNEAGTYQINQFEYTMDNEVFVYDTNSMEAFFHVQEYYDECVASYPVTDLDSASAEIEQAIEEANEYVNPTTLLSTIKDSIFTECEAADDLVICIDPGHGGNDSGAVGAYGVYEKNLNLKIAMYLKAYLEEYPDVRVVMTRTTDVRLGADARSDLVNRAVIAANNHANIFVSVHLNAYNGNSRGAMVIYPNQNYIPQCGIEGQVLAQNIQNQLLGLGISNQGLLVRTIDDADPEYRYPDGSDGDYYGVIRYCKGYGIPGIIIEHCFVDNVYDYNDFLNTEEKLQNLARADCQGIVNTYHLTKEKPKNDVLEGYSVYLDGSVGVNYYMSLTNETINDGNAYLLVEVPNGNSVIRQRIYVKDVKTTVLNDKTYYVFPCSVSAKEMTKSMKVQMVTSNGPEKEHTFSVNDYANYILEHASNYSSKDINVINALKEYGSSTQTYFNYNTSNLPVALSNMETIDLTNYAYDIETSDDSVQFVGARLSLKSNLGLKLYFMGDKDFYVDGQKVMPTVENNYKVITIQNVNPLQLTNMYTIQSGNFKMKYGFLSYGNSVNQTNNQNLKNVITSLYHLYTALGGSVVESPQPSQPLSAEYSEDGYYYIMGTGHVTVNQMVNYFKANCSLYDTFPKYGTTYDGCLARGGASTIEQYCQIFYEEAKAEGVNVQVAFVQAMLETGWLQYGGDVKPDQYNFAGLGATGGVPGNAFTDVRTGIRAQIQHLKCYASTEPLNNPCVDQRWWNELRGKAIYVEYLSIPNNPYGRGWAGSATYGTNLLNMIQALKKY